jgi:FkbM family methyltransferase
MMKNILNGVRGIIKKILFGNILKSYENILKSYDNRLQILEILVKQIAETNSTGIDFQGQAGQDMFAYFFFKGKKDGFYIDIGANDGKSLSNTIFFEKLGWHGICIEPLPDVFNSLRQNRSCDCFNIAIDNTSGDSREFIKASGVEMLSGLNNQMTKSHKERIVNEKGKIEKIYVKTLTFDDLMRGYPDRRYIDFMSIDVEGAELSILKTIDFNKFKFGLITVENNEEIKGSGETMKKYMQEQGYKIYLNLGIDIMFVPEK